MAKIFFNARAGWIAVAISVLGLGGWGLWRQKESASISWAGESAGASRENHFVRSSRGDEVLTSSIANRKSQIENSQGEYHRLYDSSADAFLISKAGADGTKQDLWLRDATGQERFIAQDIAAAKFSPDGHKIAYAISGHEIFIETVNGERLAQIPRAFDPSWRADSMALNFSAVLSLEYPELQQAAVYQLNAGRISQSGNGN